LVILIVGTSPDQQQQVLPLLPAEDQADGHGNGLGKEREEEEELDVEEAESQALCIEAFGSLRDCDQHSIEPHMH